MDYARLDDVLEILRGTGPETRKGAPNHGPMAAEAMIGLGRGDAAVAWAERYRPRLVDVARSEAGLDVEWITALGDFSRLQRWHAHFRRALAGQPWPSVLTLWLPRLIPGTMATGTHGIIRCAHAARALQHGVTDLRLEELANALAYCAARYARLGPAPRLSGSRDFAAAMAALPHLPAGIDRSGPPPAVVRHLQADRSFQSALESLAAPAELAPDLSRMTELGARLYLANAERHPLVLLHAVTGPAAFRLLVPYLTDEDRPPAFACLWQAFAAWAAAFAPSPAGDDVEPARAPWDDVIAGAVEDGDDHALKLTEAARREDALAPSPVYRAAAADWVERVRTARGWTSEHRVRAGIATRL